MEAKRRIITEEDVFRAFPLRGQVEIEGQVVRRSLAMTEGGEVLFLSAYVERPLSKSLEIGDFDLYGDPVGVYVQNEDYDANTADFNENRTAYYRFVSRGFDQILEAMIRTGI